MNQGLTQWFNKTRDDIEAQFSHWGHICYKYPWYIILGVIAALVFFSTYFPNLTVDTSTAGFLHKNDPVRVTYDNFQHEFSRDDRAVILVESDGDIITQDFLTRLKNLHEELEEIPQIAKIDSLINARNTYGKNDELVVKDLLEDWPESQADLEQLRKRIQQNPIYKDHLVDEKLSLTAIIITVDTYSSIGVDVNELEGFEDSFDEGFEEKPKNITQLPDKQKPPAFLTGEEVGIIIENINNVLDKHRADNFTLHGIGSPYLMNLLTIIIGKDMFKFSAMGVGIISFFLLVLFQRVVMIFLPITVSVLSAYFTIALMAFFNIPITTSIQILPSFLIAVGVGNSVHVFNSFYQGIDQGMNKQEALCYSLGHSGLAIVMTGLTTAGGLLSFISASIKPVSDFGVVTPMGIMCTLFFSLVLLPAMIAVTPINHKKTKDNSDSLTQKFLAICARASTDHPYLVILFWLVLLIPSLILASQIRVSHFPLKWFPESSTFRQSTEKMGAEMGGSNYMEIIIDTKKENGLHNPKVLHAMDNAIIEANKVNVNGVHIGKAMSIIDINKELHQALNNNNPDYYVIPDDQALISQELLLFENSGSDDLEDIVDTQFSKARITMKLPFVDATKYPPYLDVLEKTVKDAIGDNAEVTFTGVLVMMSRTVVSLLTSTIKAYIIAFCIITPLMILLIGSLRTGLISMIPNLTPIIITLGLMAILKIPLDAFTLLIGSIALGLAVDDTIHFMHNFQRYYAKLGDSKKAIEQTLKTTGQAMFFTSLVLSSAFFINMLATMNNLFAFGLLTGFCIIMAFLADVTLAPALVTLLTRIKERKLCTNNLVNT